MNFLNAKCKVDPSSFQHKEQRSFRSINAFRFSLDFKLGGSFFPPCIYVFLRNMIIMIMMMMIIIITIMIMITIRIIVPIIRISM